MAWGTEGILVWFFSILDPRLSDWNRFSDDIRKASEITSVKFCMHSYLHKPIPQFYKTIGYINIWLLHSQQLMSEGDLWSFNKASSLLGTIQQPPQFKVSKFCCFPVLKPSLAIMCISVSSTAQQRKPEVEATVTPCRNRNPNYHHCLLFKPGECMP